ncbi:ABC transporter permease [Streptomyces sp. NPDC059909]|uniref:ABC transporter permease n=1 Tax=Streptomyces sp. NPDC059909 TaxID=3346998 RepID=UPI00365D8232
MTTLAPKPAEASGTAARAGRMPSRPSRTGRLLWAAVSPLVLLLLWEASARLGLIDARVLPPPTAVGTRMIELFLHEGLLSHLEATVLRFLAGLTIGVTAGILVGLTTGLFTTAHRILNPVIALLYPLPRIAMFPLILILVGLNERANVLEITLAPFFAMAISTMGAVRSIDPIHRDVAASFNTGTLDLYRRITLPAVLPAIFGALRVSVGLALTSTTAVEFLAADKGLGYLIWHAWQILSLQDCLAVMAVAGFLGALAYGGVGMLQRFAVPWQRRQA